MSVASLDDIPAIAAYLRRIGAEAVNFRSATVTVQRGGYPLVIGWARFSPTTGEVEVSNVDLNPSEDEAAAIREAITSADFPKPVSLAAIADPPPGCVINDPNTFVCHDFAGQVVMVHQRYENTDGSKGFLPWTRWSDGQWRKMEPDVMPFYGLPGHEEKTTLFIHEGSKAARNVREMVSGERDAGRFPWLDNVKWGHHIGWIGGVHALERSDWDKLAGLGWKRVIVVADNDPMGKSIIPHIAKKFHCPVYTIQFTDDWPDAFDLGDKWPDHFFGDEGQYLGPTYEQCLQPATWATDEVVVAPPGPRGGRAQVAAIIRPIFAEQWAWVADLDIMVNLSMPQYRLPAGKFNGFIRPFSDTKDTLAAFQRNYSGNQMRVTYDPSKPGIVVRDSEGLQAINLYQGSAVKPVAGDWSPFTEFMEYLFPHPEDRHEVCRWVATLRARPDLRMFYGLLLMSELQGTGKGTLGRIVSGLIGEHNASFPSAGLITNSEFNGWAQNKRLIVVEEIYEGHSWKAYNRLKPYVTDETIEINVKHIATWKMPNWTHYILMSNSLVALKLEKEDRRWMVPHVVELPWALNKFQEFHRWLRRGGLAHIAYWAHTFEERGEGSFVRPGDRAPMSATKRRLIEESKSEAEQLFEQLATAMKEEDRPVALSLSSLKLWASERLKDKVYESPQAIARLMRVNGLAVTEERIKLAGNKERLVLNKMEMALWEPGRLREAHRSADALFEEPM